MATFKKWLLSKKESFFDAVENDFIDDMKRCKDFRNFENVKELESYLIFRKACPEAIKIGRSLFKKWQANDPKAKTDGLGPLEIKKIRTAIRLVWHRSHARALVVKRATKNGWAYCEMCKKKTPNLKIDHIEKVGDVDEGFIGRLFCPSSGLQGLCQSCHNLKTKQERMKDFF